jgi:hypothetical protein
MSCPVVLAVALFVVGALAAFSREPLEAPQAAEKPKPRFVDRGDYVEDTLTRLLWQKDGTASGKKNFYEAAEYAKTVKLGGISGWRVPTAKELKSIFPATEAPFTNSKYTSAECCAGPHEFASYWTSQLDGRLDDYAFVYHWYSKGGANNCYASKNFVYVRCVHDPILPPPDEATLRRAKELIAQLGDESFAVREEATRALSEIAGRCESLLREVLEKTDDAEVRSRIRLLLRKPTEE